MHLQHHWKGVRQTLGCLWTVCQGTRPVLCFSVGFLVVLSSLQPLQAEEQHPTTKRFITLLRAEAASDLPLQQSRLLDAFKKNGYGTVALHGESKAVLSSSDDFYALVNAVNSDTHAKQLVLYFQGPFRLQSDGTVQLIPEELDLTTLIQKLDTLTSKLSVILLLDVETENALAEIQKAAAEATISIQGNMNVLICRRKPSDPASPSPFASILCKGLTFDRQAMTGENQESASLQDLKKHLQSQLGDNAEIEIVSKGTDGTIHLQPPATLDQAIEELCDQLADMLKDNKATAVTIPLVAEQNPNIANECSGPLACYITHKLRRHIQQTSEKKIQVLTAPLGNQEVPLFTGVLEVHFKDGDVQNAKAVLGGNICIPEKNNEKKTISLHKVEGPLCIDEVGMSGYVNMSPSGYDSKITGLQKPSIEAIHPMIDSEFPLRITLVTADGKEFESSFSEDKRRCYVRMGKGIHYKIFIENRTNQDLFLRLLVDGRNTLPDHSPENNALQEAPFVNLARARCWFCEKNKKFCIPGFYRQVGENNLDQRKENKSGQEQADKLNAKYSDFVVADVNDVAAEDAEQQEQLGVITAAFYEAVEKENDSMAMQLQFATLPDNEVKKTKIDVYHGQLQPGKMVGGAPISIHYGFK